MVGRTFGPVPFDGPRKDKLVWLYRGDHGTYVGSEKTPRETDSGARLSGTGKATEQFSTIVAASYQYLLWFAAVARCAETVPGLSSSQLRFAYSVQGPRGPRR